MFKRSEVDFLSYQCLPLNPSMIFFPRKRVTKVVERLIAQAVQKGGTQWPSKTRWFSMSQIVFSWPMGKGQTNFLPDKKTGSPRIEKLVSTYKKCWIWGGWWWMYLRAKIEKEKLACVDMNMDNMVWHVYGTWFPHRKELKWSMMVCYLHCRSRRIGLQILHRVGLEEGIMVVAAGRRYFLANVWVFLCWSSPVGWVMQSMGPFRGHEHL